ncbi:MAG: hypothetical protein WD577_14875 [Bacteroidales bacterium]
MAVYLNTLLTGTTSIHRSGNGDEIQRSLEVIEYLLLKERSTDWRQWYKAISNVFVLTIIHLFPAS